MKERNKKFDNFLLNKENLINERENLKLSLRKNKIFENIMKKRIIILNNQIENDEKILLLNENDKYKKLYLNSNKKFQNEFIKDLYYYIIENNEIDKNILNIIYEYSLKTEQIKFIEDIFFNEKFFDCLINLLDFNLNEENEENIEFILISFGNFFITNIKYYKENYMKYFLSIFLKIKINNLNNILRLYEIYIYSIKNKQIFDEVFNKIIYILENIDENIKKNHDILIENIPNILNIILILFEDEKFNLENYDENYIFLNIFKLYQINLMNNNNIIILLQIILLIIEIKENKLNYEIIIKSLTNLYKNYSIVKYDNYEIIKYLIYILKEMIINSIINNNDTFFEFLSKSEILIVIIQKYLNNNYKLLITLLDIIIILFKYNIVNCIIICINYGLIEIIINKIKDLTGNNNEIIYKLILILSEIINFYNNNNLNNEYLINSLKKINYKIEQFIFNDNKNISILCNNILKYLNNYYN